ncbi:hypothetical protein DWU89_00280 [Parabacteroides acidifaciens]|uniref:Uncharacterized protein n=1 Tax=Parabacteroides acidifaciens TaxID=2290935 RepID=A0A3D8HJG4_9BACT|nr:hypothetical protein DWU89_00280 [Parabacteroides acidifaciens]
MTFRDSGNLQKRCAELSGVPETFKRVVWPFPEVRTPSNTLRGAFRGLGNLQTGRLAFSGSPDIFKHVARSFPEFPKLLN